MNGVIVDLLIQIEAMNLSGDQGYRDAESIYRQLLEIKLLYVTPEKVENALSTENQLAADWLQLY